MSYQFPFVARQSHRSRLVPVTRDPPSRLVPSLAIIARIVSHGSRSGLPNIFRNPNLDGDLETSLLLNIIFSIVVLIVPTMIFSVIISQALGS